MSEIIYTDETLKKWAEEIARDVTQASQLPMPWEMQLLAEPVARKIRTKFIETIASTLRRLLSEEPTK